MVSRWFPSRAASVVLWMFCLIASGLAAACADRPVAPPAALKTLPPGAYACFHTTLGDLIAQLEVEKTPMTAANFIGLANGQQPYYDPYTKTIHTGHYYDGLQFFRHIKDYALQGGDILNTGAGDPGYLFKSEFSPWLRFDEKGLMGMANFGPNTNGSQFFFTLCRAQQLSKTHTVFGKIVKGLDVLDAMNNAPLNRFQKDQPLKPVVMKTVRVFTVGADKSIKLTDMPKIKGMPTPKIPAPTPTPLPNQP